MSKRGVNNGGGKNVPRCTKETARRIVELLEQDPGCWRVSHPHQDAKRRRPNVSMS